MKTVFKDSEQCIHVWAQQNQERGRGPDYRVSFGINGASQVLYSYKTPIARFIHGKRKSAGYAVLHTLERYSPTTTRQQREAWDATSQYPRFCVRHIGAEGGRAPRLPGKKSFHYYNMKDYLARYKDALESAPLKRTTQNIELCLGNAARIAAEAERYALVFGLKFPRASFAPTDMQLTAAELAMGRAAERAKLAAERQEKRDAEMRVNAKEVMRLYMAGERDSFSSRLWDYLEISDIEVLEMEVEKRWHEGAAMPPHARFDALLRVEGEEIVTSRGARFPLSHGIRAFSFLRSLKETGRQWQRNGQQVRLGHFQIDSIDGEGNVRAGCHYVTYPEIERLARILNLI